MTNAGLKEALNKFKDRVCYIMLDNSIYLLCEYKNDAPVSWLGATSEKIRSVFVLEEIQYDTFGGEDWFGMPMIDSSSRPVITGVIWHKTDCIQRFGTVDEGFEKKRLNPLLFIR